jgi:hypothetical protein
MFFRFTGGSGMNLYTPVAVSHQNFPGIQDAWIFIKSRVSQGTSLILTISSTAAASFKEQKMADHGILESLGKKGILSSLMESPLYFTMELQERLRLVQQFGGQVSAIELRNYFMGWVKTGYFS